MCIVYCTRTSVKKSIHALINEQTEHSTTERQREREWVRESSRISCIFCVCYIRSFSVPLFLCSHILTVFMFCKGTNTNASANTASNRTHIHTYAYIEKDLSLSFSLSLPLVRRSFTYSLFHWFATTFRRKTDTQTSIIASIVHGISIERFYNRNLTVVFRLVVLGKFFFFGSRKAEQFYERILNFIRFVWSRNL